MKAIDALGISVAVIVGSIILVTCVGRVVLDRPSDSNDQASRTPIPSTGASAGAKRACLESLEAKKTAYVQLLDAGRYWDARLSLGNCADVLDDASLAAMRSGATRLHFVTTAANPKASNEERLSAIASLRSEFPADGKQFEAVQATLQTAVDRQAALAAKRAQAVEKARKKKEGVSLGMNQQDVIDSSWGKPNKINRTTYSFGVHEQWVYDGGYLYFENGILKTIQN
jgi:hypothetical protein